MSERAQSITASAMHLLMIVLAFILMKHNGDVFFFTACVIWGIYLIVFICLNCRRWMPWRSMLVFVLGTVLEQALHWFGVIPAEESDFFGGGWNQFMYLAGLILYTAVLLILNLLFWLAHRKKAAAERA